MLARVTIVWRPNVGKSSIFNSLTGHKIAIVSDIENTTRDIIEYHIDDEENQISYIMADSGGIVQADNETLLHDVRERTDEAIASSDIILLVVEYNKLTEWDDYIIQKLRRSKKEVIILANKADNAKRAMEAYEHLSIGLGEVVPVSAVQTRWFRELRELLAEKLKSLGFWYIPDTTYTDNLLKIALIGRPNVGKSSLVNAFAGETRSVVKDMPGTTRDSIDTIIEHNWEKVCLIDTAGIRRSGKIGTRNIEQWSVLRSERAIDRADVVAIVIDWYDWVAHQDEHLAGEAMKAKKGIILIINKWDKVLAKPGINPGNILDRYMVYLSKKFDFLSYAPVVFSSAVEGKRIEQILDYAITIKSERQKRIKTGVFNQFLKQITYEHVPTGSRKSHKPKVYYGSQVDINPPRFVISVNNADHFHFSYTRYIENKIREFFGFEGTPIEIELRSRKSMFKSKDKWGSYEDHFDKNKKPLHKNVEEPYTYNEDDNYDDEE